MFRAKIYCIWHHRLFRELLEELPEEDRSKVILYGVNDLYKKEEVPVTGYSCIMEYELPQYEAIWQERNYCQSSCLYHVYTHPELHRDLEYIGFSQYDMKLGKDLFSYMERVATQHPGVIFYEMAISFQDVLNQCPEILYHALPHYCRFFDETVNFKGLWESNPPVPMLHTFVMPLGVYEKMMRWLTVYMKEIEQEYPSKMSQCEYLERLHGVFLVMHARAGFAPLQPHLQHIWPLYHDQTDFVNYKTKV